VEYARRSAVPEFGKQSSSSKEASWLILLLFFASAQARQTKYFHGQESGPWLNGSRPKQPTAFIKVTKGANSKSDDDLKIGDANLVITCSYRANVRSAVAVRRLQHEVFVEPCGYLSACGIAVDLRKSMADGLVVRGSNNSLKLSPFSDALFIFCKQTQKTAARTVLDKNGGFALVVTNALERSNASIGPKDNELSRLLYPSQQLLNWRSGWLTTSSGIRPFTSTRPVSL